MKIQEEVDYSDLTEEIEKLNIEDEGSSKCSVENISDALSKLMIERGPSRRQKNEAVTKSTLPYQKPECVRDRKDSVDSGNYSDTSSNSPSPYSNEISSIIPFESTNTTSKLASYISISEKNRIRTPNLIVSDRSDTRGYTRELQNTTNENPTESVTITNNTDTNWEDIITVMENAINNINEDLKSKTIKEILVNHHLKSDVMKRKWLNLAVFQNEDIYATDTEGLTILQRLINNREEINDLPESLYTIIEEFKKNPSRCKALLDSKDTILEYLQSLERDTNHLEKYVEVSMIIISLLHDYESKLK